MNESIIKASLRRFCMIVATMTGALFALFLIGSMSSFFFDKSDTELEIKRSMTAEVQPNAQGERKILASTSPVILKVNIDGVIGAESLTHQNIEHQLLDSRETLFKDNRVKAILLSINSPGGGVFDSDSIYNLLKDYKARYNTPIYAHVDGLCASGGMYIACAADKIYTTSSSIIGSVGVVSSPSFNVTTLMNKWGIESKTLIAGKDKDELNPFRPWAANEGENYQILINYIYNSFIDIVTTNRKNIDKEKLISEYGAKVFPASEAEALGYIDGSNYSYNQTLALLAKEIGLKEDEYQVVTLSKGNWFQSLFQECSPLELLSGKITHRIEFPGQLDSKLSNQYLYLYEMGSR